MLDRLSVLMPDWRERNVADLGVALVEVLAYAADQLSYFQDAVATEAYLGTARRRASVRRHARLADYFLHDGANARAWVCVEAQAGADQQLLREKTRLLTRVSGAGASLSEEQFQDALAAGPVVFETMHTLRLNAGQSCIPLYAWGDPRCVLPRGATRATLVGKAADLKLRAGDVLILEEVLGVDAANPTSGAGRATSADPMRRHAVRLNRDPEPLLDEATNSDVTNISWFAEDALPFPMSLWELVDEQGKAQVATVARGTWCWRITATPRGAQGWRRPSCRRAETTTRALKTRVSRRPRLTIMRRHHGERPQPCFRRTCAVCCPR